MQTRDGRIPRKTFARRPLLYLLLGALACLYLRSFILLCTPIYQGDTAPIWLLDATRMLEGQMIYRDFFEFTLPGMQLVYLALIKLFGIRAWIPNATFVLLGVSLAWIGAVISKRLMPGKLAFLPSLLFLGFAFTSEPDPTHHWFSLLAVMIALGLLMEKRSSWRVAGAGALCGLATLFTQSRGVVAILGFAVFLLWERYAKKQGWRTLLIAEICLFATFAATVVPPMAYYAWKVGLARFVDCTFIFLVKDWHKWYWDTPGVYLTEVPLLPLALELPALSIWLSIHLLLPLIYLLFLARWWRVAKARPEEPWDRLMLVSIVGLFLFLGIAFCPAWLRLCSVSLPALILLGWFVKSSGRYSSILTNLLWVIGAAVLIGQSVIAQTDRRAYLETPTGRVAFLEPQVFERFRWLRDRTRPGDFIFQASDCNLYYLLGLRNPAQVSFVTAAGFTRPEQVQDVVEALERSRARFVLWAVWLDTPRYSRDKQFAPRRLAPIRDYLHSHYHLVRAFGDPDYEQVWERNP